MRTIKIGLLGFGNVGSGAYALLNANLEDIQRKVGALVEVKRVVVRDTSKARPVAYDPSLLTTDVEAVLGDPEIDVVCELIGGVDPAHEYVLRALRAGKQVVSANKELIAKEGESILHEAQSHSCDFLFEGAVAGGIPIILPMKSSLAGNRVDQVKGIVNGTTNYILSKMTLEGAEYSDVLAEAQRLGYAEADPTSDVEGFDAQYKIAILSSIAFTSRVSVEDVYVEGITRVSQSDIRYARDLGYVIKLLAVGTRSGTDCVQVRVHPALIPQRHPLASVNDAFNAIFLRGDAVGDVMFYGRGAGMMPTGSAVVGDLIDTCRNLVHGCTGRIACTCYESRKVLPIDDLVTKYYLRISVSDCPGTLAAIAGVLGANGVSIESVRADAHDKAEAVWVTHAVREANMRAAIEQMEVLPEVYSVENWIRVEE